MTEGEENTASARHSADMGQQSRLGKRAQARGEEAEARSVASDEQLAEVSESARISFKSIKYILFISIACLLLVIFVNSAAWQSVRALGTEVQGHTEQLVELARINRTNGERLIDCTTPEGTCFKESQARTGQVVGTLNATTVAAVYCSKALPASATLEQVQACVGEIVAAD